MEDGGPVFDQEAAAQEPEPAAAAAAGAELHALPDPLDMWEESAVRSVLQAKGTVLHAVAGVGDQDWTYTAQDLDAIAPPLTRILNRYEPTRAAAAAGDELAVAIGFGGYAMRSYRERRAVLAQLAEQPDVPVSGRAAEPGTGPPEPDYEAAMAPGADPVPQYQQRPGPAGRGRGPDIADERME